MIRFIYYYDYSRLCAKCTERRDMATIVIGRDKIGQKIEFEFEITHRNGYPEFTMSAQIWNTFHSDIIMGGQCIEEAFKEVKTFITSRQKTLRMIDIWRRWHLNGCHAGCVHQRAERWEDRRIDPAELPKNHHANQDERGVLAIWIYPLEASTGHFEKGAWIEPGRFAPRPEECHKDGLLTKKCPVCGYAYGSSWLREDLPQEIIDEVGCW
jgi:hypothetical protein